MLNETKSESASSLEKEQRLRTRIKEISPCLVAFSGGIDSSYLAFIAHQELGEEMLAVLAVSSSLAEKEKEQALSFLNKFSIPYRIVHTDEMDNPEYRKNSPSRCYHCKTALFDACESVNKELNWSTILYGFNADDQGDFRPGDRAATERSVIKPLFEAGMTKADIRERSRALELPAPDRPAQPCLASRLHYGTEVTENNLSIVDKVEMLLGEIGMTGARARFDGSTLRIEVAPENMETMIRDDVRSRIVDYTRKLGVDFISLDLEGFVSGKLNRVHQEVIAKKDVQVGNAIIDTDRMDRKGFPEVIFAEGKRAEDVVNILRKLEENNDVALASRVSPEQAAVLEREFPLGQWHESAKVFCSNPTAIPSELKATTVGVITAGLTDSPTADEASVMLEAAAYPVQRIYDVGVAGLQRLLNRIDQIRACDVVIVAAGMEGTLPTVIAGLVDVPVIGLPAPVGYGVSKDGRVALNTMLASCAPGLSVVNIGNGYGAAMMAHSICKRILEGAKKKA